jgi:hypothetical protein
MIKIIINFLKYCSSYYKIANYNDINACANGNEGNQLEH